MKIKKTVITVLIAICCMALFFLPASHLVNSIGARLMEGSLKAALKSGEMDVVEVKSLHGHLNGNGNEMEYLSVALIKGNKEQADSAISALKEKYEDAGVLISSDNAFEVKHSRSDINFDDEGFLSSNGEGYFALYVFDSISSEFCKADLCGH